MNPNLSSCCGRQRAALRTAPAGDGAPAIFPIPPVNQAVPADFEYTGATGLTVVGPLTGRRYRFDKPGARATVDGRDAFAMAHVPVLRRVRE